MDVVIWLVALVVSVAGGWGVTKGVLTLAQRTSRRESRAPRPGVPGAGPSAVPGRELHLDGDSATSAAAVLRGGTWIGILERLAVTGCILVGYPSGVAVVVAVKALGRFPELKNNPAASERFIIGSLASLIWAAATGTAAAALLSS